MLQRILVTGGAGFIGSHTVELLLQQDLQVVVLDNLSSGTMENLDLNHPNLTFIEGDVLEYPLLQDLMISCDAVLHLAAISSVPRSFEEPIYTFQVNTQGFLHVLQAIYTSGLPVRLVYASSAAVYGNATQLPCSEDATLTAQPLSPYALQKLQCEEYADLYARQYGIGSLGLRYFNVYGPRQDPNSSYSGVISRFISAYEKKEKLSIFGDGQQSRDFIHVKDIAKANVDALLRPYQGILNIATGKAQTLLQLIDYIEAAGGDPAKREFKPARAGDIKASYATTSLAREHLQFEADISLQEGIKSMVVKSE